MKAKFYFSDSTSTESDIIISGYSKTEIYYNDLQQADNSAKFSIPFSIELANKLKTDINNNIKCEIKDDDGTNIFTGYIRKSISFEKTQQNQPISLEIVSPSFLLDVDIEKGQAYLNKTVVYIITDLLSKCGFTDVGTISIDKTLSYFQIDEEDNIKDVINELCYEFNTTFDFDKNGVFNTYPIFNVPDTALVTQAFTGSNIRKKIKIDAKEKEADYVEATWSKIEYKTDTLLFEDTSNQTTTYKCVQTLAAKSYFAGTQYNLLDYNSTLGTVLYADSITPTISADGGITYSVSRVDEDGNDLGTQACFTAYNANAYEASIHQIDIYGNAYIETATNKNVSSAGTKKKSIELKYLHDESSVKTFVANLANYYRYANNTITLNSLVDYELGSFVSVADYGTGTYYGRITKKVYKLDDKSIEYTIETINDFTAATVGSTKSKLNISGAYTYSDFTAPTVPSISSAAVDSTGRITLVITPSTDESGVAYYKLYRKLGSEVYSLLTELAHTGNNITYIDGTAKKGSLYTYSISAVDNYGNVSALSAAKSIKATITVSPNLVTGLAAVANNADYIKLTYTAAAADSTENEAAYYIIDISRDGGTTYTTAAAKNPSDYFYYYFDRTTDGYPEKTALANYRFRIRTCSVNNVLSSSYATIAVDYSTYGTWIPTAPTISSCIAEENGIKIIWTDTNTKYYGNTTYTPVVKYNGTARNTNTTKDKNYFYTFDRTVDFYPEKSTLTTATYKLSLYTIQIKSTDEKSGNSTTSASKTVDETNYKQWLPLAPTVSSDVIGRCACLIMTPSVNNYGTFKYRVQIKKISATADSSFYKPDLSTDPYSSITAYKNGTGYITTSGNSFQQTLPLNGQNDTYPAPVSTSYQYSVIAENESGAGTASTTATITALATGATDIVNSAITENKLATGAVSTTKIVADAITNAKIADNAIQTENIATGAITTTKITDSAITTDKINANAITAEKINAVAINRIDNLTTKNSWNSDGSPVNWTIGGNVVKFTSPYYGDKFGLKWNGRDEITAFTNYFDVAPNEILELSFNVLASASSTNTNNFYVGMYPQNFSTPYTNYWEQLIYSNGAWAVNANGGNIYIYSNMLTNLNSVYTQVKTYICGCNVDITNIPAPVNTTYCVLIPSDTGTSNGLSATKARLRFGITSGTWTSGDAFYLFCPEVRNVTGGKIIADNIVAGSITTDKIASSAITADKLHAGIITADKMATTDLASSNAYFSKIAGNKGTDANNYWKNLDTTTPEFRIGNDIALETSDADSAEYIHYKPSTGIIMKVANFIVKSILSKIRGLFEVVGKTGSYTAEATPLIAVNPESTTDSTTSVPAYTTRIKGNIDASGSGYSSFTKIYNSDTGFGVNKQSSTVSANDMANYESATGMIHSATDNPFGAEGWTHIWSQSWGKTNSNWVSQIALGTENNTGMYYRTNAYGSIVGKTWTRVIDANTIGSQTVEYATRLKRSDDNSNYYIRHYWTGTSNGWRITADNELGDTQNNIHNVSVHKSDVCDTATNISGGTVSTTSISNSGTLTQSGATTIGSTITFQKPASDVTAAYFDRYGNYYGDGYNSNLATSAVVIKDATVTTPYLCYGSAHNNINGYYRNVPLSICSFDFNYYDGVLTKNSNYTKNCSITRADTGRYYITLDHPVIIYADGTNLSSNAWYPRYQSYASNAAPLFCNCNVGDLYGNSGCTTTNATIAGFYFSAVSSKTVTISKVLLSIIDNNTDSFVDQAGFCVGNIYMISFL